MVRVLHGLHGFRGYPGIEVLPASYQDCTSSQFDRLFTDRPEDFGSHPRSREASKGSCRDSSRLLHANGVFLLNIEHSLCSSRHLDLLQCRSSRPSMRSALFEADSVVVVASSRHGPP